jgi:hypothetical protein
MDVDLVASGFVQYVRVFDAAAVAPYVTLDGNMSPGLTFDDSLHSEVGGYVLVAKRIEFWDTVTAVLVALADGHGHSFNQVMRECCRRSHSRPEIDVDERLTTDEQAMFDLAVTREGRRETQGYVTPAQARAFLQASRRIDVRHSAVPPRDPVTRAYFSGIEAQPTSDAPAEAVAAIVELLHEAGVTPPAPRALLEGQHSDTTHLARIRAHLQVVHDHDPGAYAMRNAELAYLANVLAAGVTIQSRAIRAEEASNAAASVCNLGLENWPVHWPEGDFVSAFQIGWTVLHEEVCMYAADQLVSVLTSAHGADSDVHAALWKLRVALTRHRRAGSPWDARDALDVIAILDGPAWAALLGLIAPFPTLHGAVTASLMRSTRQIDAAAFEFISENAQIRQVHDFMRVLPDRLRG